MGSTRVGKTGLVKRFMAGGVPRDGVSDEDDLIADSFFNIPYTPTIEDFHRKVYKIRFNNKTGSNSKLSIRSQIRDEAKDQ